MKDRKKPEKFLPPHGMPSDGCEFAFSSRVPPKALTIKIPYTSWNYQSKTPIPGEGEAPSSDVDGRAEAESASPYWAAAQRNERSETPCASGSGRCPHPISLAIQAVKSGLPTEQNRSHRPDAQRCMAPPAH